MRLIYLVSIPSTELELNRIWPRAFSCGAWPGGGGHPGAQTNLGAVYAAGQGVPVDKVESAKWLILSAQSDGEGRRNLDALRKQLSREQLTQALEQAREIHPAAQLPAE